MPASEKLLHLTEKRWSNIEARLDQIKAAVAPMLKSYEISEKLTSEPSKEPAQSKPPSTKMSSTMLLSITADPKRPAPNYLRPLLKTLAKTKAVSASTHVHSSVVANVGPLKDFLSINSEGCADREVCVVFIWRNHCSDTTLRVSSAGEQIVGDQNVAR